MGVFLFWISIIVSLYLAYLIVFCVQGSNRIRTNERDHWGDIIYKTEYSRYKFPLIIDILIFIVAIIPIIGLGCTASGVIYFACDDDFEIKNILFKKV